MWPFKKKQVPWFPAIGDFEIDESEDYLDPHHKSIINQLKSIVPPDTFRDGYICGGFASAAIGITNSYSDIDIFITNKATYRRVANILRGLPGIAFLKEIKNDRTKIRRNTLSIDVIDYSDKIDPWRLLCKPIQILENFDLNWSMACIDVGKHKIIYNIDASSPMAMVNENHDTNFSHQIANRITKYQERLCAEPARAWNNQLIKALVEQKPKPIY
jgi:hypothetical protein